MESPGALLPDIKEEDLSHPSILLHEKMDYIETIQSNQSSSIMMNTSNDEIPQSNSPSPPHPHPSTLTTVSPPNETVPSTRTSGHSDLAEENTTILSNQSSTISQPQRITMPMSNEDLSLLPPLPNKEDMNVVPVRDPSDSSNSSQPQEIIKNEIIERGPSPSLSLEEEAENIINALDMNESHLSRSSSLKSVLQSTIDEHQSTITTTLPTTDIHIPLPRALSRSNSKKLTSNTANRIRNTSFSSVSSSSPSPISQHQPQPPSQQQQQQTTSSSPKFPLLRRASSTLLRKTSLKSNNNSNTNNLTPTASTITTTTTTTTAHNNNNKIRTSPLLFPGSFEKIAPVLSSSSNTSINNNNTAPITMKKNRPSLKLRLSSTNLSSSSTTAIPFVSSSNSITTTTTTPQMAHPPLQRNNSILSRNGSLGSKMKLNISRIISGSGGRTNQHHSYENNNNNNTSNQSSPSHIMQQPSTTIIRDHVTNSHSVITSVKSSNNPSPSTLSSFPGSNNVHHHHGHHHGHHHTSRAKSLSKMVHIDLNKFDQANAMERPIILDDSLGDLQSISKESNVVLPYIDNKHHRSGNNKENTTSKQVSLREYQRLINDISTKEDDRLNFLINKFSRSGWYSNNELNQLNQKKVIINRLWKEKLNSS